MGIDTINPKILKHCALPLTRPLCHLFNLSLSTGSIPQEWRVHLTEPVYKSADQASVKTIDQFLSYAMFQKYFNLLFIIELSTLYLNISLLANLDFCLAN